MTSRTFLNRHSPPHLFTLICLASLGAASMNIFLPSLPAMAVWFDVPYATMQLSLSLYLALSGVLQLFIGPLSDRYGRRPVILTLITIFLLATIGALIAPTAEIFLTCRMAQAVIATTMTLSRAVVRDTTAPTESATAIGWLTMGFSLVPMIAPALGGVIESYLHWKASFGLLFLLGAFVLVLTYTDLGETAPKSHSSILKQIKAYPALLRARTFWAYSLASATTSGVYFAYLGAAPAVGAGALNLDTTTLGLYLGATGLGYLIGNFISTRIGRYLGLVRMVILGCSITFLSTVVLLVIDLLGPMPPSLFFLGVGILCLGNGVALPSANAGMMMVSADLVGSAAGLGSTITISTGAFLSMVAGLWAGDGSSLISTLIMMCLTGGAALVFFLTLLPRQNLKG